MLRRKRFVALVPPMEWSSGKEQGRMIPRCRPPRTEGVLYSYWEWREPKFLGRLSLPLSFGSHVTAAWFYRLVLDKLESVVVCCCLLLQDLVQSCDERHPCSSPFILLHKLHQPALPPYRHRYYTYRLSLRPLMIATP
jgi:hypothetical protein